jgi:hypothetical protein
MIQTPKLGGRIIRYELADYEWAAIKPMLPNKPRGVPRVNDRRVLNGIFWVLRSGAPGRDVPAASVPAPLATTASFAGGMGRTWTPSIVPNGDDQTAYLVVNNFGHLGTAFTETDVERADLETVITDLMAGQYSDPIRVVAFNTAEQWAADVSQDVAHEIRRGANLAGDDLAPSIVEFVETPVLRVSCRCD